VKWRNDFTYDQLVEWAFSRLLDHMLDGQMKQGIRLVLEGAMRWGENQGDQ